MITYNKFDSISIGGPSINSISFSNGTTGSLNVAGNTYLGGLIYLNGLTYDVITTLNTINTNISNINSTILTDESFLCLII